MEIKTHSLVLVGSCKVQQLELQDMVGSCQGAGLGCQGNRSLVGVGNQGNRLQVGVGCQGNQL